MAVSNDVKIVITATDKTKGAIDSATGGVSSLGKSVKDLQPQFAKAAALGTAAFAAISGVVYKSLTAADEAAKVQAQLGAVLKSTGGIAGVTAEQANKLAKSLQAVTTYGDEAILKGENLLLTFTSIGKDIFPEATKVMLDMSVALGQDVSGSATQLGKALQDPILGVTALRRVGVNFSEAQQEMIRGLVESGQLLTAQKFILKELATEFGGSATAQAQTFGGQITQLKELVGDLGEEIGASLIPVIQDLVVQLRPIIEGLIQWMAQNPELTKQIILASLALTGLVAVVGTLGLLIPIVTAGFTALAGPVGIIIAIIIGLTVAVTNVVNIVRILQTDWQNVLEGMKLIAQEKIQPIIDLFNKLKDLIDNVISGIGRAASAASSKLSNAVSSISGRRASGGPVGGGSSYLVGEQGPEIFRPKVAGDIIPNGRSGGMSLIINITGNTLLDEFAGEKIAAQIMRAVKSNVRV